MDRMITKTLAEIYLKQGDLRKAFEIFKILSEQDPSDKETQTKLVELSEKVSLRPLFVAESSVLSQTGFSAIILMIFA